MALLCRVSLALTSTALLPAATEPWIDLGNVDCIPGIQVPRGFYLIGLKLSYSLTLESEIGHKISNWHSQLVHQLVHKACLRSA
jgi:hypothetical protein